MGPIALSTISTSLVLGLRLVVQAGNLLLVARLLEPKQFGAFAGTAALAVLMGTLATLGTHLVLMSEMSKDPARRAKVLQYAVPTTLVCGVGLTAGFFWVCTLFLSGSGIRWYVLVAIGVADILLQPMSTLAAAELMALQRTARSQLLQTLPLALRCIAASVVFVWQPDDALATYAYGYCIATAIAFTVITISMPRAWPKPSQWRWPTAKELRQSASFATLNITAMGPAELDKTLATNLLPLTAAGLYAAGARIVGAVTLPVIALMLSAIPRLFREGRNQPQRTARLLRWIFTATTTYSVLLALVLWWCSPLFTWLLGAKYEGVGEVIRWLCAALPGMALRIAAGSALMALGQPWMRAGFEVVGVVVLVVTATLFTTYKGAHGMPLALAFSEWVMAFIGCFLVLRSFYKNGHQLSEDENEE